MQSPYLVNVCKHFDLLWPIAHFNNRVNALTTKYLFIQMYVVHVRVRLPVPVPVPVRVRVRIRLPQYSHLIAFVRARSLSE